MTEFVTSSGMKRVSAPTAPPSPRRPSSGPPTRAPRRRPCRWLDQRLRRGARRSRRSGRSPQRGRRLRGLLRGGSGATAEDRIHRRRQVPRLRVLAEVEEDSLAPIHVGIQLLDETPDRVQLLLARVDDQRVGAPLRDDERRAFGARPCILARSRRGRCRAGHRRGGCGCGHYGSDAGADLPTHGPEATAREELREDLGDLLCIGMLELDDLELARRHVHVNQLQDVEEAPDVRRDVGDHQEVRVPVRVERGLPGHERTQQVHCVGRAHELERCDQGDDLIARDARLDLVTDDRQGRRLRRSLLRDDPVDAARLDGGQTVDVEDREEQGEDVFHGDPARGLDRHLLAAHLGREHVVEHHQLARGLEHDLEIGVVEVEHDETAGRWGPGLRGRLSWRWTGRRSLLTLGLVYANRGPTLRS